MFTLTEPETDLTGRRAVVTGANAGLGLGDHPHAGRARRRRGDGLPQPGKGRAGGGAHPVRAALRPGSTVRALDLADLDSVAAFADGY